MSAGWTDPTGAPAGPPAPPTADTLAHAWAQAIRDTSFVDMNFAQLLEFLRRLAERLLGPAAERAPRAVGAALVEAHFTRVESLERTVEVLSRQLPPAQAGPVVAGVATGYADALRELTRAEQQRIITAALVARRTAEDARWASEARFAAVFAEAPIGIVVSTVDGELLEANGCLCDLLGYQREEFVKLAPAQLAHPDDPVGLAEYYAELVAGSRDYFRTEKPFFRADGTVVWTDMVVSLIRDQHGFPRYVLGMLEDITERYDLHLRLRHQAQHDLLTGLPNRSRFFQELEGILSAARPSDRLGLCYLDIDGFKAVNDTLGHDVGDELIRTIGGRIGELGAGTTIAARTGGDEFVLLVPGADHRIAVEVAERALAAVRVPAKLRGQSVAVSASIGVVAGPVGRATAADLMRAADTTLYWAKSQGRNRVALFDADRHIREVTRYELTAALPDALAREEFFLEYQPLVRLRDERLVGVEALVRWRHPRWGVLGPDHFIGLAEEHGLIEQLGAWVLAQACAQAAQWRTGFPDRPLTMSVNLAPHQVRAAELPDRLAGLLGRTGVPPELLQLELTESDLVGQAGDYPAVAFVGE